MATSRIFPINWATGAGGKVLDTDRIPKAAMQSITMATRFGDGKQFAIGYVQEFKWTMRREAQVLHQIEPYPNGTFESATNLAAAKFGQTFYWPGEPIEIIPGKVGGVEITLSKYALYSANLLRSLMVIDGAGTEHTTQAQNNSDIHYTGPTQNEYVSLIQQVRPVYIYQQFLAPTTGDIVFGRVFEECWFTDIGEEIPTAERNEAILERGTLTATRIRPIIAGA
jgi:hypothetical protein